MIACVSACKRKQTLRELDSNETLTSSPNQCYNGIQDINEFGVDCGGPCSPCNAATPSCTYAANSINIGTSTYASSGTSCSSSSSSYQLSGTYGNGTYVITLGTTSPNSSIAYAITNSAPNSTQATVAFNDLTRGNLSFLSAGNVYISNIGGKYAATICGASAYSFVTTLTYTITGNVSCP